VRLLTVCAAALVAVAGSAPAQDARTEARRLVTEGIALGKAGHYRAALERFRRAEKLHPSAEHDCYIAVGHVRLEQLSLARYHLDRCRERGRDAEPVPWYAAAAQRIDTLLRARRYAPVELRVEPLGAEVSVGELAGERLAGPTVVWLPPGPHQIRVRRAGFQPQARDIQVEPEQRLAVLIALVGLSPPAVVRSRGPVLAAPAGRPAMPQRRRALLGWSALGAGGAALALGGGFHLAAYRARERARDAGDDAGYDDAVADLRRDRALSLGFYGAGLLAAGAGLYLLLRGSPEDRDAGVVGVASSGAGATVWLQGRF
jgi:hypothetical protein